MVLEAQYNKAVAPAFDNASGPRWLLTVPNHQKLTDLWVDTLPRVLNERDHRSVVVHGMVVNPQVGLYIH